MSNEKNMQHYIPEMTLEVEDNNDKKSKMGLPMTDVENTKFEEEILRYVAKSKAIFKSQQKDDPDLTFEEKLMIARNILNKNHCLFLSKFGHYLREEDLKYFERNNDGVYEVSYHINRLQRYFDNSKRQMDIKNRRYQALKKMIKEGEYFSECEMMKRNPLLYDHLVGQYMTEKQKQIRDNIDTKNITFVNLLLESMERDNIKKRQKLQEEEEENVLEEFDSDEESNESCDSRQTNQSNKQNYQWGTMNEAEDTGKHQNVGKQTYKNPHSISTNEKQILKQEFVSDMYQSFLDGKDNDFDYSTVDDNEAYDNVDLRSQDEEEKYFDSESPETVGSAVNSTQIESEDELEIYMKSLKVK